MLLVLALVLFAMLVLEMHTAREIRELRKRVRWLEHGDFCRCDECECD